MVLQLGLIITERCNIACRHCLFGAAGGNRDAKDMAPADIRHYIDRIADIALQAKDQFSVSFTGGEPFLSYRELLKSIAHAKQRGAQKISTVSNGFWGADKNDALQRVAALKEAGLSNISFSMDDFHQEHIPPASLYQAISACTEIEMPLSIKTTVTRKSRRLGEVLLDLGDLLLGQKVTVEEIPCAPEGRAKLQIPPQDLMYKQGIPREPCAMGMMLVILPNGDAYPCCGTGWSPMLYLGNARETDFDILYSRMKDQPLLMILRGKGPHYFLSYLEKAGYPCSHDSYISNCDLCQRVLTHPGLEQILPTAFHDWRVERVNKIIG